MAVFARVVEEKGFSAAARRLGLSKSAVSKHVSHLEDEVGARLLHRTTRRLGLTDVGAAFYERCARIVAEVEEAELAISHLQSEPRGVLKVSAPTAFGSRYLAPAMAEFLASHPGLRADLTLDDRIVDLVDDGYDLAVRIGRLTDSSLMVRRLCPSTRFICAAPSYLERHGVPMTPQALAGRNCLLYSYQATGDTWHFRDLDGRDLPVQVHGNFHANSGEVLLEVARSGLGVTLLPGFIAAPDLAEGRLVEVLAPYREAPSTVNVVYPHNRHLSAKVRLFVDFLAARFAHEPWMPRPS